MNTTTKSSTPFATELPEFKKNILAALSTNSGKNLPRVFDFSDFGYVIRHAQLSDLPILSKIESQCWSKGLQSSKKQLKQRLTNYPQGQFVLQLTHNKQSLVGVIYSQRVDSIAKIKSASAKNVSSLHVDQGAHLQLLAVNILPEEQHRNLGDQLLEFVLQYASVKEDLESVVAVTLCKSFHRQNTLPMEAYIHQCDQYNRLQDPILRFHQRHGASITCPVEGYRAEDKNNDGYGVLVQYNPHQRITQRLSAPTQQQKPTLSFTTIGDFMALAISPFLNEQRDYAIDRPFIEMGLDSLDLSMLAEKISSEYDFATDALFFLRHTTPHKVINFMLQPTDAAQEASSAAPVASDRQTKQSRGDSKRIDIAIIGQSCRLPTNINDPQSFWALLQAGESAVTSLPNDRWQWPNEIDVTTAHKGIEQGAFFDSVKYFDAEFFRISTPEAQSMDPQQRILMELAWHTLENAGQKAQTLAGSATGVFIGASGSDYTRAMDYATTAIEAHSSTGCSVASLANRISYFFDFHGPSLVIDTACSSSLFAIHQAVAAIQNQECQQALAGGVNIICHPANSIAYYKAGMLAPDGQCKTFDSQANGYVRGEGAVLFLLKTLTQAQQNGDHILALIKGSACNHQGQAAGLTVPNSKQQAELLRQAWHNAGVDPQSISYIEAHGTGTHLGDPVEFEGIQQAFNTHPTEHQVCGIGSVKTNIGHLEASAGAAGLLKVIMSLQHQALPSTKHFRRINPKIDTDNSSLFIVDKYQHWTPSVGYPRRAGLSSFGSGGANAHIVVEEYNQHASSIALEKHLVDGPYLFILSAANPTRLTEYTQNYLDHCLSLAKTNDANTLLGPMTYYLRHHRQALHSRLAIVANELNDLIEQLKTLVGLTDHEQRASEPTISLTIQDDVQKALADKDMTALASHWLSGASIDWSTLEAKMVVDLKVMRTLCCIPNYPFAKNAYWFEPTKDTPEHSAVVNPAPSVPNQPHQAPQDVLYTLKLVWQTINEPASIPAQPASKSAVIIGGTEQQQSRVQRYFPNSSLVTQHPDTSTEQLIEQLAALKSVEHIVWMTEQQSEEPMDLADVLPCQHSTLLALFRLFKAADSLFDDAIPLHWTVITEQSHSMYSDQPLQLSYAGLHGFVGSLAKERPQWKMRLLDIEQHQQWPSINETTPGFSDDAKPMAWREGCWHRPALVPIEVDFNKAQSAYRHGGVYVVIGGAGGLGVAWSEYLIKNYQAQIIWIGRRELDETIQLQLDRLSHPQSPSPRYLSADAADLTALQQVYQQIKTDFVQIHGVIHAAVGQFDAAFKHTDEAYFKTTLNAKIDVSVRIGQVFEQHDLDFVLFFSSVESFWRSGGYSGYSAGCSFIDQFAERLSKRTHCPVKVIHWGHWATGAGQHISKATKERLRNSGFRLLQGPESMAALECLLQNDGINQLALIKSENAQILPWYSPNEHLQYSKPQSSSSTFEIPDLEEVTAHVVEQMMSAGVFQHQQMTRLLQQLLQQHIGEYCVDAKASTFYRRWLTATQHIVAAIDFKDPQNQSTWELWHHFKNELQDESLKNAAQIVENCLLSLPDILSGEKQAMDILFPGGSLDNVEKLYRHNPVADYFNQALATLLLGAIKTHGDSKTPCKIRILEIGAGTGATTRTLLGHLSAHESRIEEYRFTDISSSFLLQAQDQLKPNAQFLTTSLLDIECPLAGQDIEPGSYDFVIATNVLHATSDMRNTLRNAKACLKPGGLIFINELCQPSLYAHLTFGLLQGWWQHQDSALRIDDSPLLSPTSWTHILESEGFAGITWPTHQCQSLGQQIMIARSDGLVRQAVSNNRQTAMLKQDTISTSATITADREVAQSILPYTTLLIKNIAAKILRIPKDSILLDEPLERYGFDSILVRQLTAALSNSFDKINTALIYQVQTFGELVDHLIEHQSAQLQRLMTNDITTKTGDHQYPQQITSSETTPSQLGREKRQTRQLSDNKIAIIGMSGRYPMAQDLAQFWQVLVTGKDSISLIPQDRWQWQTSYEADPQRAIEQGKSYCKWGGFIQGAKEFDAHFFGISPREVIGMDPQERLFVQFAWQAMEDAGHTRDMLKNQYKQRVGVFAGITRTGFELFGPHLWSQGKVAQPRTSFSSVANRLSYFLDLRGPSMPIDTMCSSSLSAVHQACQHILNGACDLAFAGGVNLYLHPASYNHLSGLQMLSPEGRCKSFGENANGFVPGEGVGIVLLKPLSQAITDGDNIHATIVGSQMNHGGKTNGYTVPNPNAQAALIADALSMSGITPQQLSYIEAHGTGTELGDPIEIAALSSAFSPWDSNTSRCALGSVKTNIGHLEAAAGIAGLTKVILQLKHQTLVPTLHADKENPNIQFADSPFKLQKQLESWQVAGNSDKQDDKNKRRLAGVSSFGAGGTNAHVIVEEYQRCHQVEPPNGAVLVLLSARNPSGLIAYAKKLGDFLSINTLHMKNLAYTTQLGREAFKCRVAMIANNQSDLQQKLASFIANQEDDNIQSGRVNKASLDAINHGEQNPGIERWLEAADYRSLSNAWVQGENVDWQQLYCSAKQTPYRISLPTYPFDNKYFWLELPDADNLQPPPNNDVRLPTAGKINLASPDELAALMHTHTSADIKVKPRFSLSSLTASMALHKPREDNVNTCDTIELPEALVTLNIAFEEDIGDYQLKLDQQMAHITNNDIKVAMLAYNPLSGGSRQHQSILIDFMAALPLPVVSTFCRKPDSLAWCIAGLSDFPLFSQFSNDDLADLTPSQLTVLNARFSGGAELSLDENKPLSLTTAPGMQVVKANQLVAVAADMVQQLQQSPKIALEALKQTLSLSHNSAIKAAFLAASGSPIPPQAKGYGCALMQQSLKALAGQQAGIKTEQQPTYITTFNNVIQLHRCADGVVQLTLCEKAQKNMFSDDFSAGLRAAFLAIEQCHDDKVVVIVGFDQYFCCGGTKDNLLAIYQHQAKFTDNDIHRVAQQCALPVIAAMQGHAIGGGWSFGLFCDLAVFSLQSTYHAPYMRYGFTPGAGSTLIFPDRLGQQLAREILLMAKEYSGFELKEKGLPMPVLPRNEVLPFALSAAHLLATQSRQQLISEKAARVKPFAPRIDTTHQRELAMHERTFVGQTQVLAHINTFFNQPQHSSHLDSSPELLPSAEKTNPSSRQHTHQVLDVLKTLLAKELMLVLADIDDDDLFVDLGIDSIIAVTWINQVNAHFNVSVGSYQVYNHPSLTAFSVFISSLTEPSNAHQASNAQTNTIDPPPVASTIPTPIAPKVLTQLRGSLAAELFMDPSEIEDDAVFIDMGMDSIHVIVWIKKINALFNCQLSTSHIYKYPTLIDLHQYLETIVANNIPLRTVAKKPATRSPHHLTMSASPPSVQAPEQPLAQSQSSVKPVNTDERPAMAVIGMAGQFPGANNLQQYWDNIASGKDCITEIGAQRWDINEFFDQDKQAQGKSYSKWMGAVAGIAHFDPLFFNISPHEAEYMDPQQRLFLQTSWHCIEDAGYNPADLAGTNCGVFVGCEKGDYSERAQHQGLNAYALLGSSMALLPARIAYYLDLQGPCMAIDTACSASLVAIANACDNLQLQNCDIAIAGGVYVLCGPQLHVMMSKAGMLSPTGRCHTFDQQADGFVPGEGVGAILLKRLSDAQQSRDNIRGVIKAWGVNQDGKSNGITAPCGQSQQRLISDTYRRFKVNPNDIQLLEAHGTGTKLGDPIEVDALCASFTPFNQQQHYCALGSVKSNIGHLATAAGIAGTLKILLALKHQQLPPTIHYQSLNEQINLDNSAFFINVKCLPWQVVPGQKRTAAINSFGFSGTNAHLVIEQYGDQPCPTESEPTNTATTRLASLLDVADANATIYPFVLSAANKARLLEYSRLMAAFVDDNRDNRDFSLADFSYTLCLGRKPMDARLGLTFSHIDELIHKLDAFQNQQPSPGYIYADKNQQQSSSLANTSLSQGRDNHLLSQLDAWVKGATIEWSKQVFSAHPHKRCSIPHYPFSKDIYWLEYPAKSAAPTVKQLSMSQIKWLEKGLNPVDLSERFKDKQQHPVVIVYGLQAEKDALMSLLTSVSQSVGLNQTADISCYHYSTIETMPVEISAMSIFVIGVNVDQIMTVMNQLNRDNFNHKEIQIYGLSTEQMLTQAMINSICRQNLMVVHVDNNEKPLQKYQLLLREWLSHDGHTNTANRVVVRHDKNQRFQSQDLPMSIRVGHGERQTDVPAKKQLCRINKSWRKQTLTARPSEPMDNTLVIVNSDNQSLIAGLLYGEAVTMVLADSTLIQFDNWQCGKHSANRIITAYGPVDKILDLSDLYATGQANDSDKAGKIAFYQQLVRECASLNILYLTQSLHSFNNRTMNLAGAKFAGLATTLSVEHPDVVCRHVDVDLAMLDHPLDFKAMLSNEFPCQRLEPQICYRQNQRYVATLTAAQNHQPTSKYTPTPDGVYVISGGLGGIGLQIADYLVQNGAKKLVLMGFNALPDRSIWHSEQLPAALKEKINHIQALEQKLDHLSLYTGSLENQPGVTAYFDMIRAHVGAIVGVVHSAGKGSDFATPAFIAKNQQQIATVMAPKVAALDVMCNIFADDDLAFFVAFSSLTALIPRFAKGCFDYAMANHYVERLMAFKNQHHHKGYKAISWVDWHECGMATRSSPAILKTMNHQLNQLGLFTHSNNEGKALFEQALQQDSDWVLNCYMDLAKFETAVDNEAQKGDDQRHHQYQTPHSAQSPAKHWIVEHIQGWEVIVKQYGAIAPDEIDKIISFEQIQTLDNSLIHRIYLLLYPNLGKPSGQENGHSTANANQTQRLDIIRTTVCKVLKLANIDDDIDFQDYGLDSISATQLALKLEQSLTTQVKSHWLIDFPTINALADKLPSLPAMTTSSTSQPNMITNTMTSEEI